MKIYLSNSTDGQWNLISLFTSPVKKGGRPWTTDECSAFNALLYMNRTGCQGRYFPENTHFTLQFTAILKRGETIVVKIVWLISCARMFVKMLIELPHIAVDVLGLLICVIIHNAATSDCSGKPLYNRVKSSFQRVLEIIKSSTGEFKVVQWRWIFEISFESFNRYRKINNDLAK